MPTTSTTTTIAPGSGRGPDGARGALRGRGGRRLVAPLAGIAFAAALVAGCGGSDPQEAGDDPAAEAPEEDAGDGDAEGDSDDDAAEDGTGDDADEGTAEEDSADEDSAGGDAGGDGTDEETTDDSEGSEDGAGDDDAADDGGGGDDTAGDGGSENLFEGTWGFGHDTKTLSAEELTTLVSEEAEARGPEEMNISVECGDGIDSEAGDLDAECIAYGDEGAEHLWLITANPADAGLEIEVENAS